MHLSRTVMLGTMLVMLAGCTTGVDTAERAVPTAATKEYRQEPSGAADGFTLRYPDAWFVADSSLPGVLVITPVSFDENEPGNTIMLLNAAATKKLPPEAYVAMLKTVMERTNSRGVFTTETFMLNGFPAARLNSANVVVEAGTVVPQEFSRGSAVSGSAVHIAVDGPASRFILEFTMPADDASSASLFEEIVQSFTVLPAR